MMKAKDRRVVSHLLDKVLPAYFLCQLIFHIKSLMALPNTKHPQMLIMKVISQVAPEYTNFVILILALPF